MTMSQRYHDAQIEVSSYLEICMSNHHLDHQTKIQEIQLLEAS